MSQSATMHGASAPDRLARLIQQRVFGDRVNILLEVRLWGGRIYRFGAGESAVKISLWGSAYAFLSRSAEAFRVVLERPPDV